MKKNEITNQELLQAINQNIDQKLDTQTKSFDRKLESQKNEILTAMDAKTGEILDAVLATANLDEQRFQKIETSLNGVKQDLNSIKQELSDVKGTVNTQTVTKDYLDDKFAEFGVINNNKHKRVAKLSDILHQKKLLQT